MPPSTRTTKARLPKRAPRVGFVSLGCPKALVDSEQILTQLRAEGYAIAPSYDGADLVVVNTCGFIDAAVAESLDAIGEALAENGKVIVTGMPGRQGRRLVRARRASEGAGRHRPARDAGSDVGRARTPAAVARSVRRSRPELSWQNRCQAHADALRVSQDQRRLQPPLHVLHHPVDARRLGLAPDRRGARGRRKSGEGGRQGTAGHLAGHQRLRRGRQVPDRLLAGPAGEDEDGRAREGAGRNGRLGAAALRLSVSARRRRHSADGRRQAAALPRRPVPAREPADTQAHEAAGQRREHARPHPRVAGDLPRHHDPLARSSPASPARPMPSSRSCWPSSTKRSSTASGASPTRRSKAPRPMRCRTRCRRMSARTGRRGSCRRRRASAPRGCRRRSAGRSTCWSMRWTAIRPSRAPSADAPEIDGVVRIAGGGRLKVGTFARVVVTGADAHDLDAQIAR